MRSTAALILTLLAAPALAAGSWQRFELPDRAGYWELDKASVTPTKDGTKRVLMRMTYSGLRPEGASGRHYDQGVSIMEVDCEKRLARVVDAVLYMRAERIEPSRTTEPWTPAPATSPLYTTACGS